MSPRQKELVDAITQYRATHGVLATQTELAAKLGVSRTRITHIVSALERKGIVGRRPGSARTLHVLASA
jgi:DNA-binding MarR family transcriptional regulator